MRRAHHASSRGTRSYGAASGTAIPRRRCVRDDRAMDKLIAPRVAQRGLVSPQECVGVCYTRLCPCRDAIMAEWTCHDPRAHQAPRLTCGYSYCNGTDPVYLTISN